MELPPSAGIKVPPIALVRLVAVPLAGNVKPVALAVTVTEPTAAPVLARVQFKSNWESEGPPGLLVNDISILRAKPGIAGSPPAPAESRIIPLTPGDKSAGSPS